MPECPYAQGFRDPAGPAEEGVYLVVPSLLKTRASRRGETSHVLEDRKSRCFGQGEWNRQRLGIHLRAGSGPHAGTPLNAPGRSAGPKSAPWKPGEVQVTPPPGHALPSPRKGRRWRLPRQKSFLHGLCRPLRPHPGFGESDSAELASLHLLPRTRSARRNYRIAGARLMRSNYPPPLFSAALCCAGPTHPN
ncbi:LOW QUALITY PROTEIN: putative uncharacterized protein encoded by LINC03040 [Mustela nigripes]|uniref:LOW QUALITY PROTEIN: putative uncharacterized protein encoded by LINC03040 n=1 Tax=Mustela nigripes TaxID=77151 RepID=UPI002814A60A|nr:LOW QUALITY PROTEIN: putative uncharacterized protein encoded by LINC03040 [Mustela nigripes]